MKPGRNRSTKDGPWCWQSKAVRRLIRDAFDATNNVATALAVYDALTEIASNEVKEEFVTTHAWIQTHSGVSVSTIKKHLRTFSELGVVSITTSNLRTPCRYRLLALGNHDPSTANDEPSLVNASQEWPLASLEEDKKNSERTENNSTVFDGEDRSMPGTSHIETTRPRARDVLFDALALVVGANPSELTGDAAKTHAVALAARRACDFSTWGKWADDFAAKGMPAVTGC